MRPKTVVINTSLAVVLLGAAVGAVLQIEDPAAPKVLDPTAVVSRSTVTSTVAAAGNTGPPRVVGLPFAGNNPGLVKAVYTSVGQVVEPGEKLAEVDDRSARNQLAHAKASVAAAEAAILAAKEGETPGQAILDRANIAIAVQQLRSAHHTVERARIRLSEDEAIQENLVSAAAGILDRTYKQITHNSQTTTTGDLSEVAGTMPPIPLQGTTHHTTSEQHTDSSTESEVAIEQANQVLEQARATRAAQLLADAQDIKRFHDDELISRSQVMAARAQHIVNAEGAKPDKMAAAEAQLAEAQAQVADAQLALDQTVLYAPFHGVVMDLAGNVGETPMAAARGTTVSAAVPVGPGSAENRSAATQSGFVVVADMSHQYVTAEVNEADIAKVAKGQPATVTFPATGNTMAGKVDSVDEQETVVNNVVEYKVQIALDSAEPLRPGQSAAVQIVTASRPNVLSVPNAAIIPSGGGNLVAVRRANQVMKVPVTVGLVGDSATEITGDVRPGDVVILPSSGAIGGDKPLSSTTVSSGRGLTLK